MSHPARRTALPIAFVSAVAILIAACSSGGTPPSSPTGGGSGEPTSPPSGTPVPGTVDHKTGATDVLLRYEEGGGFVMPAFLASQAPHFTLYGDGTVIFRNPALEMPPAQGSTFTFNPMRTAKLSEDQIQELLVLALGEGGLATARPTYENNMVADASTAIFTIDAGAISKSVSVYALGLDTQDGADAPARAAFAKLAERLTDFDQGGSIPTEVYAPEAYRAVLIDSPGMVAPDILDWPWPDLSVADFEPSGDPNGLQFPQRVMSPEEVAALGVDGVEGGLQGLLLNGTDGKLYTLALRPLLPDDET